MLTPDKHTNLELCVLNLAGKILMQLKTKRIVKYKVLLEHLYPDNADDTTKVGIRYNFLPAINLLYLLGILEYHKVMDSFEYIERHAIE